jgi:hypothetical protein
LVTPDAGRTKQTPAGTDLRARTRADCPRPAPKLGLLTLAHLRPNIDLMGRGLPIVCALALLALPAFASVDVSVDSINSPRSYVGTNDTVIPVAVVGNRGTDSTGFAAWMTLIDPYGRVAYVESLAAPALPAGQSVAVEFPPAILRDEGRWSVRCSVSAAGDTSVPNNVYSKWFHVTPPGG